MLCVSYFHSQKKSTRLRPHPKFADIKPMSEWFNFIMVKHDMRGKKNRTVVMLTDILIIFIQHHIAVYKSVLYVKRW